jgi:hypothetical protein
MAAAGHLRMNLKGGRMKDAVYCLCSSEAQANAVIVHLRNAGLGPELSIFLHDRTDTKDISLKENAIRGARIGGLFGGLVSLAVPGIGPALAIGPILVIINGAVAGGVVGGLLGGTGALKPMGLPEDVEAHFSHKVSGGEILIAVHASNPAQLDMPLNIFNSEGARDTHDSRKKAA